MNYTLMEYNASLRIGSVEFISPDEITVAIDIDAPDGIAANGGLPRAFPRINSYVLILTEAGHIVSQVEWIKVESAPFPKRRGFQDFGIIDLPYPIRKMRVNPVGMLKNSGQLENKKEVYKFERGVQTFPIIGDPVLIPTDYQLRSIVESGENRRVNIGTSPLAANAEVSIDPDKLFGRHLAVLGNTGSGKSCSVAGLIQWSLDAVLKSDNLKISGKNPSMRFIILDPNGEYSKVFCSSNSKYKAKLFKVDDKTLTVPLWFWNSAEWATFTQASDKVQKPLLKRALREIKAVKESLKEDERTEGLRAYFSSQYITLSSMLSDNSYKESATKVGGYLESINADILVKIPEFDAYTSLLSSIQVIITDELSKYYKSYIDKKTQEEVCYYIPFNEIALNRILESFNTLLNELGGLLVCKEINEDMPIPFDGLLFANHLQELARSEKTSQFVDTLVMRLKTILSDQKMNSIIYNKSISLDQWLTSILGDGSDTSIAVIDLSLVPIEIIHIVITVISRMVFESLQYYRKISDGKSLPTVLVMEEAHTFIKRYNDNMDNTDASKICCQVFEKIAREGRKYGLGLVLSSQRPSELSPTVLSQCNTFLIHRLSNDRDQEYVSKLIPDNLHGLLRELPSLPPQVAILLGWASELPVMVRMNDLDDECRPQSDDPEFWDVWTLQEERLINWKKLSDYWQKQ